VKGRKPLLEMRGLSAYLKDSGKPLLKDLNLSVGEGERVGLLGQSGSGKSLSALAAAGLLPPSIRAEGSVLLGGREIIGASEKTLNTMRGRDLAIVFQEAAASLDPLMKIEKQIALPLKKHSRLSGAALREKAYSLLSEVKFDEADIRRIAASLSFELSGGQQQRAALAIALASSPRLLIADEALSSVDERTQKRLIELLLETAKARGMALIFISHDIAAVREIAGRILIMKGGRIVETPAERGSLGVLGQQIKANGKIYESKNRIGPSGFPRGIRSPEQREKLFELSGVYFGYKKDDVLKNISLDIAKGESLGIIGESGSGKTTLLSLLLRLETARRGNILFSGRPLHELRGKALKDFRAKVQPVFQDPFLSLDPAQKVESIIGEALISFRLARTKEERKERIRRALEQVGLGEDAMKRRPAEFSGGQRQRIAIARALVCNPEVLIADEPVSALDAVTKNEILKLLHELKEKGNFTLVFVSHDIQAAADISERIMVLRPVGRADLSKPKQA
jgi:ABC-type glutathione transport system ATPase component